MWLLTVDSSMKNRAPISVFESPRATSSSTSRSRGVRSCSLSDATSTGGWLTMRSITRRVTDGDSSESPAAIV
jgi:hypothetical protein